MSAGSKEKRGKRLVKVLRLTAASVFWIVAAANASAQVVDVAKISCKQYLAGTVVRQDYLSLWLSGYVNGTHNDTVIERSTVQNITDKVGTYCRANLDAGLMDGVQTILGAGK